MATGELNTDESATVRATLTEIGTFIEEHGSAIINALSTHARRMAEGADLADEQRQPAYSEVFRLESAKSYKLMTELTELLDRLSEDRQEQFVDSAD